MRSKLFLALVVAMLAALHLAPAAVAAPTPGAAGQLVLVQAAPGTTADVLVDGRTVRTGAGSGAVVGPLRLAPGRHEVRFVPTSGGAPVASTVRVLPGSSGDVVLHLPAAVGGAPVLTSYAAPTAPIGPGKARLVLAHTATVPPADVRFDGTTVFRNIANGEYAEADVPDGTHDVALLPSGVQDDPLLGPLALRLDPRTVTMVYAVGSPRSGSMNVITHVLRLDADGAVAPTQIRTGSAGLASGVVVHPFSASSGVGR